MRRLFYLLREAYGNVRVNRAITVVAIVTTAFTFACVGVFLLLYLNLRSLAGSLQNDIKVGVYVQDDLPAGALAELEQRLKGDRAVAALTYVSKEQALRDFQLQFPSDSQLLQGLGLNPLPASFVVTLATQFRSPDSVKRWAEGVKEMEGVSQVEYSQDWIDMLAAIVRYIELAAIGVGLILSTASVTIIANTIRLTLYARRDELAILRLIGATRAFLHVPYLLEGALLGALGSALSLGILWIAFEWFSRQIHMAHKLQAVRPLLTFFPVQVSAILVLIGMCLGCAGSYVSLIRFGEGRE
jgi:cell division transport system permease protein